MHRRPQNALSFGTILAIVALVFAAAYQLFTKGLPEQFSAEGERTAPRYDAATAGEALKLFRKND